MSSAFSVSVIICAYTEKRLPDLLAAVASVQQQSLPPQEIIVVIDHNPQLLYLAQEQLVQVTLIENTSISGLRGARSCGLAVARGQIIAFLDDDAIAAPDWLKYLCEGYDNPDVLGTGGAIMPMWATDKPVWFPEEFYWVVGCTYRGMPCNDAVIRNPIGANMSLRREVFDVVGGFHDDIANIAFQHAGGCEETELCIRAQQHWPQKMFLYLPKATVRHRVPDSRMRWSYFYFRCYAEGVSKAVISSYMGVKDSLASERTYTRYTLPMGIKENLWRVLFDGDWVGLARIWAILSGLAVTVAGYGVGSLLLEGTHLKATLLRLIKMPRSGYLPAK